MSETLTATLAAWASQADQCADEHEHNYDTDTRVGADDELGRAQRNRAFAKQCRAIAAALAAATARADRESLAHRCAEGVIHAVIYRIGGTVEGGPTGRHNFLQRVDALVTAEAERDRLRAELARYQGRIPRTPGTGRQALIEQERQHDPR